MPLALLSDLKPRLDIEASDTSHDTLLTALLAGVSVLFDQQYERELLYEDADVTEQLDGGRRDLPLKRWPITSIASVKESATYDWASATALTADVDYVKIAERGILTRLPEGTRWLDGRRVVQVVYCGGWLDPADLGTLAYVPAHIQEACLMQAVEFWNRKDAPGYKVVVGMAAGMTSGYAPAIELLPIVKQLMARERR